MSQTRERVFCAFCKNPKYVRLQKHLNWTNGGACLLLSLSLMFAFWQSFDPRFLIFFACSLALTETMVYVGWRMSVRCDSCAFDPVLYRNNPAKAAEQVKLHLDDLRTTGKYLLKKNNPFAHLEVQKKPPAEQPGPRGKPEHGQILSRQI